MMGEKEKRSMEKWERENYGESFVGKGPPSCSMILVLSFGGNKARDRAYEKMDLPFSIKDKGLDRCIRVYPIGPQNLRRIADVLDEEGAKILGTSQEEARRELAA